MKKSISEEMRVCQRMCEFAMKYGVTSAARKYQTNRQFVYRQLARYNGDVRSLAFKSRKPHYCPHAHSADELRLIRDYVRRYGKYGYAEVYVKSKKKGYSQSFGSMCRQIRLHGYTKKIKHKKSYCTYANIKGQFPGDKVQIDIKFVPDECIRFPKYGNRYYQVTAIDEYSRKRVLKIVKEKSTYETSMFLKDLEKQLGFKIITIQTDNGTEFINDAEKTSRLSLFELTAEELGYKLQR